MNKAQAIKPTILVAAVVLAITVGLLALAIPANALADDPGTAAMQVAKKAKGKNITGKANTKTLFQYGYVYPKKYTKTKKTVKKYDVTGDKKADKVKFVISGVSGGYSKAMKVYINGKKQLKLTDNGGTGEHATVQLATLKNGISFLYVKYTGNNGDGTYAVYQYKKGHLKKVLDENRVAGKYTTAHRYIDSVKASGNKLEVVFSPMTLSASMVYLKYAFPCKNGKLKLTAKGKKMYTGKDYSTGQYKNELRTASTQMTMYTSKNLKTKKATIWQYDEVEFINSYLTKNKLLFKVKCWGEVGWMEAATTSGPHNGTYFEETGLAG